MSSRYLHFNIFGLAITEMAAGSGSIKLRLMVAYMNYLYKLDWKNDIEFIPKDCRQEFNELKKILSDDLLHSIEEGRKTLRENHAIHSIAVTDAQLSDWCNARTVLRAFHWRKAKRAAELLGRIYLCLGMELRK